MNNPTIAPFGAWESPITAEAIVRDSVRLGQIAVDGRDVYWSELRPSEKGRSTIVKRDEAGFIEVLPAAFNARTRAHEYGGGAFCVSDGDIFFCNDADQRIYRVRIGETPVPLTPEGAYRYADLVVDREHDRLICVREDHTADGEPENTLVAVRFDGSIEVLAEGRDFYAAPRVSSGGPHIAWIQWQHPNMPWDETELVIAKVDESGAVIASEHVAGGDNVAIFQPEFAADGSLFYVSDAKGWWNIYRYDGESDACVYSVDAEFGLPHWVFGMRTYDFNGPTRLAATFQLDGISKLAEIDIGGGSVRTIPVPHIDMSGLRVADGVAY
ncbi:MAG: S9 family peptidase, partial [Pseudomonadota bacterium]|nr:S9 family peptidase [Pseudomonadota bacterium]